MSYMNKSMFGGRDFECDHRDKKDCCDDRGFICDICKRDGCRDVCRKDFCDDRKDSVGVVLNASTGGAGPLPIITTLLADPISVVSVTLDTDKMCKPSILLNFTGIISLPLGISVTLNFEVLRIKNCGAPIKVGSTYTFSTIATVLESESFAFQLFDANLDPGTYTYSVVLSTNSIIDITPGLTIVNATLSGLAVDADCCKCKKKC